MIAFKCKMCGGDLKHIEGATTCECEYCGSRQTIPVVDDERIASLYNKANALRQAKEFDKAQMVYESITEEKPDDAEAYWGAALCHFGIEYVEDPYTHDRKPTLHRMQYESILADQRFRSAIEKADAVSADLYQEEAELIDRILKRYQAISAKEQPYDVFICYKETETGNRSRTRDSVYAQEIYDALSNENYHTFFSRITLEDKLGEAYEPYIFAALNSAKVMLVVGTSKENFNSDWVQNEWRRYLYLMKKDNSKKLIPVYRDMDAYELPEEFIYLQSQDYSKIGAIQDLLRGVDKIIGKKKKDIPLSQPVQSMTTSAGSAVNGMLDRAFLFLEDGKFSQANQYAEKVLDQEPKNAKAYLAKMMAEKQIRTPAQLANLEEPFDNNDNYQKILRFGDEKQKTELLEYNKTIIDRIEEKRLQELYDQAKIALSKANTVQAVQEAKKRFLNLANFRDSRSMVEACDQKMEQIRNGMYTDAIRLEKANQLGEAIRVYEALGDYKDAKVNASRCREKQAEQNRIQKEMEAKQAEEDRKRREAEEAEQKEKQRQAEMITRRKEVERKRKAKRNGIIAGCVAAIAAAVFMVYLLVFAPMLKYKQAVKDLESGKYDAAAIAFTELNSYSDSKERLLQIQANRAYDTGNYNKVGTIYATLSEKYQDHNDDLSKMYDEACGLLNSLKYDEAIAAFTKLGRYSDSQEKILEAKYQKAAAIAKNGQREAAIGIYKELDDYKDSQKKIIQLQADELFENGDLSKAWEYYNTLDEVYHTHNEEYIAKYTQGEQLREDGKYDEAISVFTEIGTYSDAAEQILETQYQQSKSLYAEGKYDDAEDILKALNYKDSTLLIKQIEADKLYLEGKYAEAWEIYNELDDVHHTYDVQYAAKYSEAENLLAKKDYDSAYDIYRSLGTYKDSTDKAASVGEQKAGDLIALEKYGEAAEVYRFLGDNKKATQYTYIYAKQLAEAGEYKAAANEFGLIPDYEDSREQRYQMGLRAKYNGLFKDAWEILSQDPEYEDAKEMIYQTALSSSEDKLYEVSVPAFTLLQTYKDSAMKLIMDTYAWGGQLYDNQEYDQSAEVYASMGDFSDAPTKANEARYAAAKAAYDNGDFEDAAVRFAALGEYKDSTEQVRAVSYSYAKMLLEAKEYEAAKQAFGSLGEYLDSVDQVKECDYRPALELVEEGKYQEALSAFKTLGSYRDSALQMRECAYQLALNLMNNGDFAHAAEAFDDLKQYSDSLEKAKECRYALAKLYQAEGKTEDALILYQTLKDYSDSEVQVRACYYLLAESAEIEGDYEQAYSLYSKAEDYNDATTKAQQTAYQIGINLSSAGKYEEAINWLIKAENYSDSRGQILSIAEYYYSTSQYDLAEIAFAHLSENPTARQRLFELGQYYELVGDTSRAYKAYKEAGDVSDAADNAERMAKASYQKAETLMAQNAWKEALEILTPISGYLDVDSQIMEAKNMIAADELANRQVKRTFEGSAEGFGGLITVHMNLNGNTVEILTIDTPNETLGLGAKASEETFTSQFVGKEGPFTYGENGIDALASATITSTAVLEVINSAFENQSTQKNELFIPGVYSADAQGLLGAVMVELILDENRIVNLSIDASGETPELGGAAADKMRKAILNAQTPNVDIVSGATVTSNAIIKATTDALEKAGADIATLDANRRDKDSGDAAKEEKTVDTEIVIVGAGGAGMTAAIMAKQAGVDFVILEKMPYAGGNTTKATGGMNAAETHYQKEQGIEDSVDLFVADTIKGGHDLNDPELVRVMAEKSSDAIDWLDTIGAELPKISFSGGASVNRIHAPADGSGVGEFLVQHFREKLEELGVEILYNTKATELLTDADGRVIGVKAEGADCNYVFNCKEVILATGGFGANEEMYTQYRPDLKGTVTTNAPGATGDGIIMAQAVGADLVDIEQIQLHPTVEQTTSMLITESVRGDGAILVNQSGVRFTNELLTRDAVSAAELAQEGCYAYIIFDQNLRDHLKAVEKYVKTGITVQSDTIEGLAEQLNIDPATLAKTLADWNECVKNQNDPEFGRTTGMEADLTTPPYYAIKIAPGIHHTMGGVKIDTSAHVINTKGEIIPGLYAAGEVTGGVHGGNRLGGNAVADIVIFGRIAAESAINEKNSPVKETQKPESEPVNAETSIAYASYMIQKETNFSIIRVLANVIDGKIADVKITSEAKSEGSDFLDDKIRTAWAKAIVKNQTADTDAITGATLKFSAFAVKEAVDEILQKIGK